jgi:hypothetical protein
MHDIFQVVMGWSNSHLHSFTVGDALYRTHLDDYPDEEIDEQTSRSSRLSRISVASSTNTTSAIRGPMTLSLRT